MSDSITGYAVGERGANYDSSLDGFVAIFKTTNGGAKWTRIHSDSMPFIHGIVCDTSGSVILAAEGRSLFSRDGGLHWFACKDTLFDICKADGRTSYAIGTAYRMLRTIDGGASWQPTTGAFNNNVFTNTDYYNPAYAHLAFADSLHGVVTSEYPWLGALQTSDGGRTWLAHDFMRAWSDRRWYWPGDFSEAWLNGVTYVSSDTAFVFGAGIVRNASMLNIAHFNSVPSQFDFNGVRLGTSHSDSVFVYNTGTAPLIIRDVSVNDDMFTVTPHTRIIRASEGAMFFFTFTPRDITPHHCTLTFRHDGAPTPDSVIVMGHGFGGPVFKVVSDLSCQPDYYSTSKPYINLGTVALGSTVMDSIVVRNEGDEILNITNLQYQYAWAVLDSAMHFPRTHASIAPQSQQTFPVVFSPTSMKLREGGYGPAYDQFVKFTDNTIAGTDTVCLSARTLNVLRPQPSVVDFGIVDVDSVSRRFITLHNTSSDTVAVWQSNLYNSIPFFISDAKAKTFLPGDSVAVQVDFIPHTIGSWNMTTDFYFMSDTGQWGVFV